MPTHMRKPLDDVFSSPEVRYLLGLSYYHKAESPPKTCRFFILYFFLYLKGEVDDKKVMRAATATG